MKWTSHAREGLLNLFSAKLRSILALLGILVGTASVVAMVSGGELATNEALKQFKTLGTDLLAVTISDSSELQQDSTQTSISLEQANSIINADKNITSVAPYSQLYNAMQFEGHDLNGSVVGVTSSFAHIVHVILMKGRFISDLDRYAFYCVIGNGLYKQIQQLTVLDPIGQQIQVGKNIFTIIGVANPWPENNFVYANIDNSIMIPILTSMVISKYAMINNVVMLLNDNSPVAEIENHIQNTLHQLSPNKKLYFRSPKELIARMAKQNQILTIFLGLIGGVSLIVGGIGVMNIMLVSVVERRREIGIRLAVGATSADIRLLFLFEAVMLAVVGGVLGVFLGVSIAYVIAFFSKWQFTLFLLPPVIGFVISVATGIFFGFYPAHQASQWNPIDALRSE